MARNITTPNVSDGEIVEDLSEFSSDDNYFDNLSKKLSNRKLELELENSFAGQFADYGKENRFRHRAKRPSTKKKKRIKSGTFLDSRSRAYRASSIFSNYSLPKRKTTQSKRNVKTKNIKTNGDYEKSVTIEVDNESVIEIDPDSDESSDEELLKLRLNALKSKPEVRDIFDDVNEEVSQPPSPSMAIKDSSVEEVQLRIMALKSAMLKKRHIFKEKKKKRTLENERPYSPSEDVIPIPIEADDPTEMEFSPLGSPFNEVVDTENQQIDMEISNSPIMNEERETSDMDIAPSPSEYARNEPPSDEDNNEEIALRSLLLTSIQKKKVLENENRDQTNSSKDDHEIESMTIENLKMAVQRLKQKKKESSSITIKSGTKTIAMLLEEKQRINKVKESNSVSNEVKTHHGDSEMTSNEIQNDVEQCYLSKEISLEKFPHKNFLVRTITNDLVVKEKAQISHADSKSPSIETDQTFSTITDTKSIPLIAVGAKRSRLVTSLEAVNKPVSKLIISVNAESDTDDDGSPSKVPVKRPNRKILEVPVSSEGKEKSQPPKGFEINLDNFLKTVRLEQETKSTQKPAKTPIKAPENSQIISTLSKSASSVKHLPLSSQIEYEQLIQKMKILEESKQKRLKVRQIKRTNSGNVEKVGKSSTSIDKPPQTFETKTQTKVAPNKIEDSLRKIPHLDADAKQRFIDKTETTYKRHSDKLMTSTQESIKLLQENEDDMKKQEKLSTHVANLERLLKKYKSNLNIVNQRVTVNIHKIVQSQREMFKLRTHQKNFGKICQQVGVIIRGDGYSLPEDQSMDIEENFMKIAGKTEDIIRISNDENVKSNMKIITDRVKSFVNEKQKNSLAGSKVKEEDDKVNNNIISAKDMPCSSIPVTANTSLDTKDIPNIKKGDEDGDKEVSEVSKLIETIEDTPISLNSELTVPVEYPEIGKRPKKLLDEEHSMDGEKRNVDGNFYKKKLKYESPLDFLRLSKNKYETKK